MLIPPSWMFQKEKGGMMKTRISSKLEIITDISQQLYFTQEEVGKWAILGSNQ